MKFTIVNILKVEICTENKIIIINELIDIDYLIDKLKEMWWYKSRKKHGNYLSASNMHNFEHLLKKKKIGTWIMKF